MSLNFVPEQHQEVSYFNNRIVKESTLESGSLPMLCSGYGQYHTDEPGKKIRNPYTQINLDGIRKLVHEPQKVDKPQAQWIIPSTLLCRSFKKQEQNGQFYLLWADIDQNPKGIHAIAEIIENIIPGNNFEIYTSKSASEENQKCRLLIPSNPLPGRKWILCQEILNDKLREKGVLPDRKSEGAAQLCYLPNRGKYYATQSKRDGLSFDPESEWSEFIQIKLEKLAIQNAELERSKSEAKSNLKTFDSLGYSNLIEAFNAHYKIQDILLRADYDQKENKFRHPNSESGSFSASVKNDRVHSLSSKDPLYTGGSGGGAHDAFSAFVVLFHNGDRDAALKDAGDSWLTIGYESWNTVKRRDYSHHDNSTTFDGDIHFTNEEEQSEKLQEEKFILDFPPGLAGEVAEYIFKSSRIPIKSFSIAGALTAISYLNQNYSYVLNSDTPLNLYQCLIGDTGKGKEDPRRAIKRLADATFIIRNGSHPKIHESMASGAALLRSLDDFPNSLILNDEFGMYLQNTLSDRGSIHQKELIKDLMTLWGLGRSYFGGKSYADKKQNIDRIDKPYINLMGTTTSLELLDGITPKAIDNGFLNRILFIQSSEECYINRSPETLINQDLLQKILSIKGVGEKDVRIKEIVYEDGAHDLLIQLVESLDEKGQFTNLWSRAEEQAIRVAGLLAIGDGGIIKRGHVFWAWNYTTGSIKAFARKLDKDFVENPFQKQVVKALDFIKNVKKYSSDQQFGRYCGRGLMPRGKLTKLLKMKSRDVEDVILYLIETRQINHCDEGGVKCFLVR
ncbi:MAG: DUF3987 domain-containing protein [Nitrosomonas sp.]|nr:DUF3987 domain-containing protein [Nitrosomonas sp.]